MGGRRRSVPTLERAAEAALIRETGEEGDLREAMGRLAKEPIGELAPRVVDERLEARPPFREAALQRA